MLRIISTIAIAGAAAAQPQPPAGAVPHLSQAWIAQSSGDGLPGEAGKESYLYMAPNPRTDCPLGHTSDDCMNAHVFDYGAHTCVKVEIDAGFKSQYSGTYLIECDSVDCCYEGDQPGEPADVKQWDIFHSNGKFNPTHPEVKYIGKKNTTELNDVVVPNADVWTEVDHLPFTKGDAVNYTYYITLNNNRTEVISHRIDFFAPGAIGSILYGDFQVQHDLGAFRTAIKANLPDSCTHANVLPCNQKHSKKWNAKLPRSFGSRNGL
jgi:hypothetical protein